MPTNTGLKYQNGFNEQLKTQDTASREYHIAKRMSAYFDAESKPFIHLIDGGVSNNLGGRGPTEIASLLDGNKGFENIALEKQHHLAIIVVNARTPEKYK